MRLKEQGYRADADQEPSYWRGNGRWQYFCYRYIESEHRSEPSVVHGRLYDIGREVIGDYEGEELHNGIGKMVWRGERLEGGEIPEFSTGWMFLEALSGPPFIWDWSVNIDWRQC